MKRPIEVLLLLTLLALPVSAQNVDFGVWAVSTTLQGDNLVDEEAEVELNFDEEIGYGATVDLFWSPMISTELGVYGFGADGSLDIGVLDESIDLGSLDVMPITLTVRAHFGTDRFDAYVGAGGAFVTFDKLESEDLRLGGVEFIEIDDETTWLVNAGLSVGVSGGFRIGLDAKWVPLEGTAIDDLQSEELPLELDPLMLSGGLIWRY